MLQVFEKVGISLVEDMEAKQFVISVNKKAQKGWKMHFIAVKKPRIRFTVKRDAKFWTR